jgi:hypothetical protein
MLASRAPLALTAASLLAACATAPAPTPTPAPSAAPRAAQPPPAVAAPAEEIPPRPADADADVDYYRERATALATETLTEIARTNFVRMRRGRLYLPAAGGAEPAKLEIGLSRAFEGGDHEKIVELTGQILSGDQADIRAHMLRAVALRKLGRDKEANFHREAAIGLIESIVRGGDGRSFETAWTVYRVKEEYEVLKAGGYLVERQSLASHGNRNFDVLDARKPDGSARFRAHFDVTELFAEEGRAMLGRVPVTSPR